MYTPTKDAKVDKGVHLFFFISDQHCVKQIRKKVGYKIIFINNQSIMKIHLQWSVKTLKHWIGLKWGYLPSFYNEGTYPHYGKNEGTFIIGKLSVCIKLFYVYIAIISNYTKVLASNICT